MPSYKKNKNPQRKCLFLSKQKVRSYICERFRELRNPPDGVAQKSVNQCILEISFDTGYTPEGVRYVLKKNDYIPKKTRITFDPSDEKKSDFWYDRLTEHRNDKS